jgi:ABC-2 type transport system ATP-binding protein
VRLRDPERRPDAERILRQTIGSAVHLDSNPAALSAQVSEPELAANTLTELHRAGVVVTSFSLGQPSLDEVFLALTGRPVEDETELAEEIV